MGKANNTISRLFSVLSIAREFFKSLSKRFKKLARIATILHAQNTFIILQQQTMTSKTIQLSVYYCRSSDSLLDCTLEGNR